MNIKKYSYLGDTGSGLPSSWEPIVLNMLKEMDKSIRPWYIPIGIYNGLRQLSMEGSMISITNYFWYNIMMKFNKNTIYDIKNKYASLRVYGEFDDKCNAIIKKAIDLCGNTCEYCGGTENVTDMAVKGWVTNLCEKCRTEIKEKKKNGSNN